MTHALRDQLTAYLSAVASSPRLDFSRTLVVLFCRAAASGVGENPIQLSKTAAAAFTLMPKVTAKLL